MAEYIDREALKCLILNDMAKAEREGKDLNGYTDALFNLKTMPTADVAEVVHAAWKWGKCCGREGIYCTNCQCGWVNSENAEWIAKSHDYCPKCGAKMDGER